MKTFALIASVLFLVSGSVRGQQAQSALGLRLNRPQIVSAVARTNIQAKVTDLLQTSNFNSMDHPEKLQDGVRGLHQRYRDTLEGEYLVVTFSEPRQLELIRGRATAIEVVVGLNRTSLNGPQRANRLFTVDPEGRIVEHVLYSGMLQLELLELVRRETGG